MEKAELKLKVSLDDEPTQGVLDALHEAGATDVQPVEQLGALGLATVVLAVLVVDALASLVARLVRLCKAGVVVDARGSRVVITKDPSLPAGSVLLLSKDGTKLTLDKVSDLKLADLLAKAGLKKE
jgi:hypothetical protein